jgi:biopolymer transport protein ExbD
MQRTRRPDLSPRVEMMPLLDVIFLLLTFFIYALVTMVEAQVVPLSLTTLATGQQAEPGDFAAVTIDRSGQVYFNREPISDQQIDQKLASIAERPDPPRLLLAMEQPTGEAATQAAAPAPATQPLVDRGPMLIDLFERVRKAGVTDVAFVGQPKRNASSP